MSLKKFKKNLRKDLSVRRSGLLGLGKKIEVTGEGLSYWVDIKNANAETAAFINSRMPVTTLIPRQP